MAAFKCPCGATFPYINKNKENIMNHLFNSKEVLKKTGISLRQLYYWELKGIVTPQTIKLGSREFKRYTTNDITKLKNVKSLIDEGYILDAAVKKVNE